MKNIRALLYLSFLVMISFVFTRTTIAQTTTPNSGPAASQRWVCLDAQWCEDGTTQCRSRGSPPHTVKLSAKPDLKLLSNIDTYIVECISGPSGQMCTTGKPDVDMKIYGTDNSSKMAAAYGYKFDQIVLASDGVTPGTNPTKSNAAGDIGPFEWESSTTDMHARKFLAVNFFNGVFADPGQSGGQQQGTLDFETSAKDCTAFNWDPYGRVFDSKTLEPLKGVSVSLLKQRDGGTYSPLTSSEVVGGAIVNPQTTGTDGSFSFVVPNATYHLVPTLSGYKFPVDSLTALNTDYTKVYKDVYPAATGMDIVEKDAILHRDIPMEAVGAAQNNPPEMMEYFTQLDKLTNSYIIEGRVSHPFTTINIWTEKVTNGKTTPRYRKIVSADADKTGYFKIVVNQKDFEQNETIGEAEMVKKTAGVKPSPQASLLEKIIGFFIPQARAQEKAGQSIKLDPIPNYIEGIAYDAGNRAIPNATVGVYLTFSNVPYYSTKADETGHFRITSEYLPFMPFTLRFTGKSGVITKTDTQKFLAQNEQYITQNNININAYKDSKGRTGEQVLAEKGKTAAQQAPAQADAMAKSAEQQNNFAMVIFVIMLLVVIAAILVLYLKNKKKAPMADL